MPDLLLELYSEEIPARMQLQAQENLKKLVTGKLVDAGLTYEGAKAFSTPRRLTLAVHGVLARAPDLREEKKGPRVGAPAGAIQGFLKAAGLKSIDEAKVQQDKKGDFYVAVIEKKGRPAPEVIAEIVPEVVRNFPWPKSMRWGEPALLVDDSDNFVVDSEGKSVLSEPWLSWVRPLHSILCTFGPETEEPEIVRFEIGGVQSGDVTRGHPVMAPGEIKVKRLEDYLAKLDKAKVVADRDRRKASILADAKDLALAQGLELVEDEGLLDEVAGLVEWPVVLLGEFDKSYLDIPPEVIRATIRANQKCFVLHDPKTGKLANKFVLVANIEAKDGGAAIKAGNARVIRARLADAKFFWDQDRKTKLEDRLPKFSEITFHEKLGTQAERIERIARLAKELAPIVKADPAKAERAARLSKLDLVTEMVGEFPELQGLMGKYYALAEDIEPEIANALEEHYKPQGPGDRVPTAPVSVAVALADKIDTLAGFWLINEKPTGSKDPYALRRAALGLIRLTLTNNLRIRLEAFLLPWAYGISSSIQSALSDEAFLVLAGERPASDEHFQRCYEEFYEKTMAGRILSNLGFASYYRGPNFNDQDSWREYLEDYKLNSDGDEDEQNKEVANQERWKKFVSLLLNTSLWLDRGDIRFSEHYFVSDRFVEDFEAHRALSRALWSSPDGLFKFLIERLKVYLREQGARHDLVDAVFSLGSQDDLLMIVRRVEALGKFLATDDGQNLLAGYKRAANILGIEEKKDKKAYSGEPDVKLLKEPEEKTLADAIQKVEGEVAGALKQEDFEAAMSAISKLRQPVDAFFDKVTVNADDKALRENRLKLLNRIRAATRTVADFSKIGG